MGNGIQKVLKDGKIKREDVWVTSKVPRRSCKRGVYVGWRARVEIPDTPYVECSARVCMVVLVHTFTTVSPLGEWVLRWTATAQAVKLRAFCFIATYQARSGVALDPLTAAMRSCTTRTTRRPRCRRRLRARSRTCS